MLLHGERVVGPALHGRVVGDDHAGAAGDLADAGDQPRARQLIVVDVLRRERRELEERRSGIEQRVDPARAPAACPASRCLSRAAALPPRALRCNTLRSSATRACMAARLAANSARARIDVGGDLGHRHSLISALCHCHPPPEGQNCRTVGLSNYFGSDDNGVSNHARRRLPRIQFRSWGGDRHRARSGAPLRRGAHRAARQRDRSQQRVSARLVARARRARLSRHDRRRRSTAAPVSATSRIPSPWRRYRAPRPRWA